jgi:hypothetical protein
MLQNVTSNGSGVLIGRGLENRLSHGQVKSSSTLCLALPRFHIIKEWFFSALTVSMQQHRKIASYF